MPSVLLPLSRIELPVFVTVRPLLPLQLSEVLFVSGVCVSLGLPFTLLSQSFLTVTFLPVMLIFPFFSYFYGRGRRAKFVDHS